MNPEKNAARQIEVIKKNANEIISEEQLRTKISESLKNKSPLRIKAGFDPTASDIHIGHVVLLKKLRQFQDLGHIVYFIVGDFTALIGDPSGRIRERPVLTKEQIIRNAETYTEQAFKILDKKKTKVLFNSKWFENMSLSGVLSVLKSYTVARMLERDDFNLRIRKQKPISMLEFIYPLLQGYDSVEIKADVELGGADQKFNLIVARHMQEFFNQSPQSLITLPLLIGTDGQKKMSKSFGNYIGIREKPVDIFGKTMSISDELMLHYYDNLTDFDLKEIKKMHPKEAKELLAYTLVAWFFGRNVAEKEKKRFEKLFSDRNRAIEGLEIIKINNPENILDLISNSKILSSKNQIRRLVRQGAVEFCSEKITDDKYTVKSNGVLKVGKKKFFKIIVNKDKNT